MQDKEVRPEVCQDRHLEFLKSKKPTTVNIAAEELYDEYLLTKEEATLIAEYFFLSKARSD